MEEYLQMTAVMGMGTGLLYLIVRTQAHNYRYNRYEKPKKRKRK